MRGGSRTKGVINKITCVCAHCQKPFEVWPHKVAEGKGRFCSRECRFAHPRKKIVQKMKSLEERFWENVQKSDGCWLWIGTINNVSGYGQMSYGRHGEAKLYRAHRLSYEIHFGSIPEGQCVCHDCDKNYPSGDITYRRCVRPDHLFLGTDAENIQDAVDKGRMQHGERHHRATLTDEIVREGRRRYAAGETTIPALAKELGIGKTTVWNFLHGYTWSHVKE
jgi:hypothetical protein